MLLPGFIGQHFFTQKIVDASGIYLEQAPLSECNKNNSCRRHVLKRTEEAIHIRLERTNAMR